MFWMLFLPKRCADLVCSWSVWQCVKSTCAKLCIYNALVIACLVCTAGNELTQPQRTLTTLALLTVNFFENLGHLLAVLSDQLRSWLENEFMPGNTCLAFPFWSRWAIGSKWRNKMDLADTLANQRLKSSQRVAIAICDFQQLKAIMKIHVFLTSFFLELFSCFHYFLLSIVNISFNDHGDKCPLSGSFWTASSNQFFPAIIGCLPEHSRSQRWR